MASRNSKGRMIYWKISYCKDLAKLSMFDQLLFTWLIPNTDNLGRMEGDPAIIKGMVFPYHEKVTVKMVEESLKALANEFLIFWYQVGGNWYIEFPNFEKYQQLSKNNSRKSDYPDPPKELIDMYESVCTCTYTEVHVPCEGEEKRREGEEKENIYSPIISYLNQKAGTNYRHTTKATRKFIDARLNEKFTFEDFKAVIDKKVAEWKGDKKMEQYLRPETLFGTKFESYLNQKGGSANGAVEGNTGKDNGKFKFDKSAFLYPGS